FAEIGTSTGRGELAGRISTGRTCRWANMYESTGQTNVGYFAQI
ncbi:42360_t:CDS:2, partial [Gigaspora margarita]